MEQSPEGRHICHAILRGKANQQVFESEIQKKKLLDAAVSAQREYPVRTLAYCVLDNEVHLILEAEGEKSPGEFLNGILRKYKELCLPYTDSFGVIHCDQELEKNFRKSVVYRLRDGGVRSAMKCCERIHMLPVTSGVASHPGDYWWCSFRDYRGRRWLPLADPGYLLREEREEKRRKRQDCHGGKIVL